MPAHSLHLKLFRQQAVEASRFRALGQLPVRASPGLAVTVFGALSAGALIVVAAAFIEVPERVRVGGVLLPEGKLLAVRATRAGLVRDLGIRDGEWVYRGQRLLRIGDQQHSSGDLSSHDLQRQSLERELELLESERSSEHRQAMARLDLARQQHRLSGERLEAATGELASRMRLLDVRTRRLDRAGQLLERDAIAKQRHDELKEAELQARAALKAAEQTVIALRSALLADEEALASQAAEPARIETRTAAAREALLRQLSAHAQAASEAVTSPDGGVVAALLVRNGSAVAAGQLLLQVADPENALEAYFYLPSDLAGRVAVGQQVEMRLHAYPYQRFGTLEATVSFVSGVPVPATTAGVAAAGDGRVYEVRAQVSRRARDTYAPWSQLPAGAAFSADIVRTRWPLYRWALRALTSSG